MAARLGEPLTKDLTAQALRTALDPQGDWIPAVLAAADRRLTEVRRHVPDAGGLVIATDQDSARAYAALLHSISGEKATVVLSDEKAASKRIAAFTESDARWMVAVRMVSEGVDVPRLAVGVYATTHLHAAVLRPGGGPVRAGRGPAVRRHRCSSPRCRHLLGLAAEMEVERDHVLGRAVADEGDIFAAEHDLLARANADIGRLRRTELGSFEAVGSQARFDQVVFDGGEFGHAGEVHVGSDEEMDFLGIPGLLEPDQVRELLPPGSVGRAAAAAEPGGVSASRAPTSSSPYSAAS